MSRFLTAAWRCSLPLFVAALITTGSVWLLGVLNMRAISGESRTPRAQSMVVLGAERELIQPPAPSEQPKPQDDAAEFMEVDLDLPAADPIRPGPLEFDLLLPAPTFAPLLVATQPDTPKQHPRSVAPSNPRANANAVVRNAGQVDEPPRESPANPSPAYPRAQMRRGAEGVVVLRLLIDEQGAVQQVEVVSGAKDFVRAVKQVVDNWRFTPARHRGRAVKVWGRKRVTFKLR